MHIATALTVMHTATENISVFRSLKSPPTQSPQRLNYLFRMAIGVLFDETGLQLKYGYFVMSMPGINCDVSTRLFDGVHVQERFYEKLERKEKVSESEMFKNLVQGKEFVVIQRINHPVFDVFVGYKYLN